MPHSKVHGHNKVKKREGGAKRKFFFGGQLNSSSADVSTHKRPSHSPYSVSFKTTSKRKLVLHWYRHFNPKSECHVDVVHSQLTI